LDQEFEVKYSICPGDTDIKKGVDMEEEIKANELWERADNHEILAKIKIASSIKSFNILFKDIYEAGILVGTLRGEGLETAEKSLDKLVSGLLLKQILTDLRVIWNLVSTGFTLQAATLAASHFEMSITLKYIIGNEESAKRFLLNDEGNLPWKIKDLCKLITNKEKNVIISQGKTYSQEMYEMNWRSLYVDYIWLCKIKHPSMQSLLHGSISTKVKNGKYLIMSFPDVTTSDLPTKTIILISVINHTYSVIMDFFELIKEESNKSSKNYIEFQNKIMGYPDKLKEVVEKSSINPLAVNLIDNKIYKEFLYYSEKVHSQK
jgi:hypothetical protein